MGTWDSLQSKLISHDLVCVLFVGQSLRRRKMKRYLSEKFISLFQEVASELNFYYKTLHPRVFQVKMSDKCIGFFFRKWSQNLVFIG